MIEYPEGKALAKQVKELLVGKQVKSVLPPTKLHRFCWFGGDPTQYNNDLAGAKVVEGSAFGIYVEIKFSNSWRLCWNDGVNARLYEVTEIPKQYQLAIIFEDDTALVYNVAMYGSIVLHQGLYDNEYYLTSKMAVEPFSEEFRAHFDKVLSEAKPSLSCKAFLATGQRFPGIGNGVTQDILLAARQNPKRKVLALSPDEIEQLYASIQDVLGEMLENGGRDTEKDLLGRPGGYSTKLSKNTYSFGCPLCGSQVCKENFLGGSIYYCTKCQSL